MRCLLVSALLVVLAYCGYPVPENTYPTPPPTYPTSPSYPLPKKYPVAPTYPVKPAYPQTPSYSAPPPPPPAPSPSGYTSNSFDSETVVSDSEYTTAAPEYRQKAKARTAHNRQFQRRSLQPIRRFQQKKQ